VKGAVRRPANSRHVSECEYPAFTAVGENLESSGILDRPLEPVIGLAEGETRWRAMTA